MGGGGKGGSRQGSTPPPPPPDEGVFDERDSTREQNKIEKRKRGSASSLVIPRSSVGKGPYGGSGMNT